MNQRWRDRTAAYRPAGEPIDPRRYEVAEIPVDGPAKAFVLAHHYAGTYPAARWRFGLYRGAELVGVAVFSHPCNEAVITSALPVTAATDGVELGRFVLLDDVPGNGESWFLGQCYRALRGRVAGVVSFSDPLPRRRLDGGVLTPGHVGTIIRRLERGWRYAVEQLVAAGAPPLEDPSQDEAARWLAWWLPVLTRTVRHPGNHRYAWSFARRRLVSLAPFPKRRDGAPLLEAT